MKVRIVGRYWDLRFVRRLANHGECDGPLVANKQIRIRKSLKGEKRLEVLLHEALHAMGWHLSEESVDEAGRDLARMLWRLGYRGADDVDE